MPCRAVVGFCQLDSTSIYLAPTFPSFRGIPAFWMPFIIS